MWSKLGIRVLSGVIGAALVLAIILFASPMWFNLVVSVACIISLYELCKTFKLLEKKPMTVLVFVFAILLLSAVFMGFSRDFLTLILVGYLMLLLICAIFWNGKIKFQDVCTAFFFVNLCGAFVVSHRLYTFNAKRCGIAVHSVFGCVDA